MKAVVLEIKNKDMIIMDQSGCFHNMRYDNVSKIGEEILFVDPRMKMLSYVRKITAIAAMLLVVIGSGYGAVSYYTPYTYVDIDINPSLELVLNRYLKVLDVQNLNEDANKIVPDKLKFKHKDMQTAINELIDNAETQKIISIDKDNDILFTVSSKNEKVIGDINKKIENASKKKLEKLNNKYEIMMEKVALNKRDDAKKQKVSPGRIILFDKLKEVKPDAKLEDVKKTPVRETLKLIKQYKKEIQEKKVDENKNKIKEKIKNNRPIKVDLEEKKNNLNRIKIIKPILKNEIEKKEANKVNKVSKVDKVKQAIKEEINNNKNLNDQKIKEQLKEKKAGKLNINKKYNNIKDKEQVLKKVKERLKKRVENQPSP